MLRIGRRASKSATRLTVVPVIPADSCALPQLLPEILCELLANVGLTRIIHKLVAAFDRTRIIEA